MPTIEIDGKKVSYEGKKMILQVAQDNGIDIPSYCYHPGLSIVASCRICLGEIEASDPKDPTKLLRVPKLVPTCQTPATDGMKVYTQSPKARANQKAVMEFLLINHPLDCPVCDQAGECGLQDYSYQYGRGESRFLEDKAKKPKKDVGDHILLYSDRCIMCTRCVRFTREVSGTSELAVFGRGYKEEIDIFPGRPVNNPLAGNVVDLCPVGALLDKDFLFTQRVWFLKSTPSISPINAGGENIFIHHSDGRIYRIKPRQNLGVNKWWISDETRYGFQFVHSATRLRAPERIQYGSNAEIGWTAALKLAEDDLRGTLAAAPATNLVCLVSPFDGSEEIFLQIKYARSLDPHAWIVVNPVRSTGTDQVFKHPQTGTVTYTLHAEKAPNRTGAEKIAAHFGGNLCSFADLAEKIKTKKIAAALLSADMLPTADEENYSKILAGINTIVRIGLRKGAAYEKATLSLPACSWAEKDGIYENAAGSIQAFVAAISPLHDSRSAGQIFWDLLGHTTPYSAAQTRSLMAAAGLPEYTQTPVPVGDVKVEEMQFAEL